MSISREQFFEDEKDLVILREVAAEITSKLEIEELLPKIVDSAVSISGSDAGIIGLYDPAGDKYTFSYVKNLPKSLTKVTGATKGVSAQVLQSKKPIVVEDYSKEEKALPEFVEAGIRGTLIMPMVARGQIYGALGVAYFKPHKFSSRDVSILQSIADQAAIAIENALLYNRLKEALKSERYISERLSRSLMPTQLPKLPHTELGVYYLSSTPEAYVGGDFYDYLELGSKTAFVVGDVSGKGVEVASLMAMARNVVRTLTHLGYSPVEVITKANQVIYKEVPDTFFIALSYYVYDWKTGEMEFINAGQRHAYYCSSRTACNFVVTWQPALGIISDYIYESNKLLLGKGDVLSIFTDGLVEVRRNGRYFEELLPELVHKYSKLNAQKFTDVIIDELVKYNRWQILPDDIVLLTIKRV